MKFWIFITFVLLLIQVIGAAPYESEEPSHVKTEHVENFQNNVNAESNSSADSQRPSEMDRPSNDRLRGAGK